MRLSIRSLVPGVSAHCFIAIVIVDYDDDQK